MAILSTTPERLQSELKKLDSDCTPLNLIFKPAKCATLVIERGVVREIPVKLKGRPIKTLNKESTYKYLGIQTGAGAKVSTMGLLEKVTKELDCIVRSDLIPPQKLDCVKTFALSKLTYMNSNSMPPITEMRKFANIVMRAVKVIHSIPIRGSPLEYVQLPIKDGGLGVPCPRITNMVTFVVSTMKKL